jgi:5-methyltetrahydrofolate--homocysteine methyltransferase
MKDYVEELREAIINGDREEAEAITKKALESNIDPQVLIQEAGSKAMDIVGQRFNDFEIFLPDLTLAADAMKGSVGLIIEKLKETGGGGEDSVANVVLGTCFGDMHDIGKNLVSVLMATAGYRHVFIVVYIITLHGRFNTYFKRKESQGQVLRYCRRRTSNTGICS